MIAIIPGYGFRKEGLSYVLYRYGTKEKMKFGSKEKTGEIVEYKESLGYFTSLTSLCQHCIKAATEDKATEEDVQTIAEYIAIMKQIGEDVRKALEPLEN